MYNAHRGMPPAAPGPAPNARLIELLDQVRAEFDSQGLRYNNDEESRKQSHQSSCRLRP